MGACAISLEERGRNPPVDLYHHSAPANIAMNVGVAREKRAIAQSDEISEHLPRLVRTFQGIKNIPVERPRTAWTGSSAGQAGGWLGMGRRMEFNSLGT